MTDAELEAIEVAAKAATPGPWECGEGNVAGVNIFGDALWIATVHQNGDESEWDYISPKQMMKNAAFVAAANPVAILELIAELRQVRRERDWLASQLEGACYSAEDAEYCSLHDCNDCKYTSAKVWLAAAKEATCQK